MNISVPHQEALVLRYCGQVFNKNQLLPSFELQSELIIIRAIQVVLQGWENFLEICWILAAFDNYNFIIGVNTAVYFLNLLYQKTKKCKSDSFFML